MDLTYSPLARPLPMIVPSMMSSDGYAAALAYLAAPTALRGRLRVFAFAGVNGAAPVQWKRKASANPDAIRVWARAAPGADVAARTGVSTGLAVVQADDADALAVAEATFGDLPRDTVRSLSRDGRLRLWMRIPSGVRTLPTRLDLAPGLRLLADGAYVRLPPSGYWTTAPDDPSADYQPLPQGWIDAAAPTTDAPPEPTVRFFPSPTRH